MGEIDYSQLIKNVRKKHGLTQKELANRISGSNSYISLVETGVKQPGVRMLKKLNEVFPLEMKTELEDSEGDFVTKIPKLFKRIREKYHLNQKQLAEKIKSDNSYISLIEAGKAVPSKSYLNRLEQAFSFKLDDYLESKTYNNKFSSVESLSSRKKSMTDQTPEKSIGDEEDSSVNKKLERIDAEKSDKMDLTNGSSDVGIEIKNREMKEDFPLFTLTGTIDLKKKRNYEFDLNELLADSKNMVKCCRFYIKLADQEQLIVSIDKDTVIFDKN